MGDVEAELFELPPTGDYAELVSRLESNPDFLRFASEDRLRDAELRLASTLRRPDVTVGVGVRRLESGGDEAFVASVSVPLFGGRRSAAAVAEARAGRELAGAERGVAEIKARSTLYELHRQLGFAVLEARTLKTEILPRTEEALKETEFAYERGRFSYLEWVDAQREYLAVQSALIQAAVNAHLLRTEIERLTNAPLTAPSSGGGHR
jgi:cobalt-zinc-cadmium efflux system outer membrane protein